MNELWCKTIGYDTSNDGDTLGEYFLIYLKYMLYFRSLQNLWFTKEVGWTFKKANSRLLNFMVRKYMFPDIVD